MYFSGFADEVSADIHQQIKATKELGWSNIESRVMGSGNIHNIPDEEFEKYAEILNAEGIQVNCFGSTVANWAKDPMSEEDFQTSIQELERALKRMHVLGTKMIRAMSFKMPVESVNNLEVIEDQVFKKVKYLVSMCENAGITYVHENCMNYGGMSYEHTLKLIEAIDSPNFKLAFDTGNPVNTPDFSKEDPFAQRQNSFEFYTNVKNHIGYIHIKDSMFIRDVPGQLFPKIHHTFPGEGDGFVNEILTDLLLNGYDDGISIEPHMGAVFHEEENASDDEKKYQTYVEYGRRLMNIVKAIKPTAF